MSGKSPSISTVLPIAGAIVGGVATMSPAGAMAGYSLGSAAGGAIEGGEDRGNASGLLGSQRPSVAGQDSGGDFLMSTYEDQANPTGQMPAKVEGMSLPQGTEAPGGANKAALTGNDYAGYATTAMQAISAAQKAQQDREIADQALENSRWRDPKIVTGPSYQGAATGSGQFPTVGQGFIRY